jgi:AcrB/AcrD/AcrF family
VINEPHRPANEKRVAAKRVGGRSRNKSFFNRAPARARPRAVPLMIGTGTGSKIRQPLGYTIVGGLFLSQLLTLYTTPVTYLYLDRCRVWASTLRTGHSADETPSALPAE